MEIIGTTNKIILPEDFEDMTNEDFKNFKGIPGIYFLMNNDELIYIGQSYNIKKRIKRHAWAGFKTFNWFMYLKIEQPWERDLLETLYIEQLQPKYNHTGEYDELTWKMIEFNEIKKDFEKVKW